MHHQESPPKIVLRNAPFMFVGLLLCGIIGYFVAGSDGRALGGGIGAGLGLILGGIVGKRRK